MRTKIVRAAVASGSFVEFLNLMSDHHWLFGVAAAVVAFLSGRHLDRRAA